MKKLIIDFNILFIFIFLIALIWGTVLIILNIPIYNDQKVTVDIKKGESLAEITYKLYKNKVIDDPRLLFYSARIFYDTKKFQAGKHHFEENLSISEIISNLQKSESELVKLFIPEGANKKEIFAKLKKINFANKQEYHKLILNEKILNHSKKIESLEGFLYPDTYFIAKNFSEQQIISIFLNNFKKKLPKDFEARAKIFNLTGYELLILASIIEKETGYDKERTLVSSVFHNRLKRVMRLQTDPTVIYGIKDFNGNLRRKHLRTYTPYNTYMIPGLPPTPISNPSLKSLQAAMYPAKTKYLYFVAKGDGTSYFSTNLKEHNRAVKQFQLKRKKNYRSAPAN